MGIYQYTFTRMPYPPTWTPRFYDEPIEVAECNKEDQIKEMEKKNPRLANQLKSLAAKEKLAKDFKYGTPSYERIKASAKRKKKKK